jgi:glycyl-tRNA synthetase (class II)
MSALDSPPERLQKREQTREELAHYAKATVDIEYLFPGSLGFSELEEVANRQDYDLTAHSKDVRSEDLARLRLQPNQDSTTKLDYFDDQYVDPATGKKGARNTSPTSSSRPPARPARHWLSSARPMTKRSSESRSRKN